MIDKWPKTRKEARAVGALKYFTGKPCKRGHVATRLSSCGVCEICGREAAKEYSTRNREKRKEYYNEWCAKNPDKRLAANLAWQARNPEKVLAIKSTRRARELNAAPKWLTEQDKLEMRQKYLLAKIHESVTGMKWHVDHIVPLKGKKVCGLHVPWNLQVIPATENNRKNNKFEVEL